MACEQYDASHKTTWFYSKAKLDMISPKFLDVYLPK